MEPLIRISNSTKEVDMEDNKKPICEVLRLLRISKDMSIKDVADKSGISVSYITELEKGNKSKPSLEILDKYSNALQVNKSAIMFFVEEYSKNNYGYQQMLLKILDKIVDSGN